MNDIAHIFTILFLMLGPFKILGPYANITANAEPSLARKIAMLSVLYASASLLLAAVLGERILEKFGIPVPILSLSGGIILFLVALLNIIKQFNVPVTDSETAEKPTIKMAIYPLAFPTIVTPYGIAAVIVFLAISHESKSQLMIGAVILGIMVINLILMLLNRYMYKVLSLFLPILGAILGVVQVALGIGIMYRSLMEILKM